MRAPPKLATRAAGPGATYGKSALALERDAGEFADMAASETSRELLARTTPELRATGERKLAHDFFMQATWAMLGVAALVQLFLLVWLDVMS